MEIKGELFSECIKKVNDSCNRSHRPQKSDTGFLIFVPCEGSRRSEGGGDEGKG